MTVNLQNTPIVSDFTFTTITNPTITSLSPSSKAFNYSSFTLTINGTGFVSGATITISGGTTSAVTFVNSTQMTCTIATGMSVGSHTVTVTNPDTGFATSTFTVTQSTPTISSISPSSKAFNYAQFTMTITGTGFGAGESTTLTISVAGGTTSSPTYVSSTSATVVIATGLSVGTHTITLTNQDGGSATSTLTITQSTPTISSVSPTTQLTGYSAFTFTVNGTNLGVGDTSGATITIGGNACTGVTVVSSVQLTCTAPSGIAYGDYNVVVTNNDGGTVTSTNAFHVRATGFTVISNRIMQNAGTITSAKLTATTTGVSIPQNSIINYFLSNDDGSNWYAVTSGTTYTFISGNTNLKWKAVFNRDDTLDDPRITRMIVQINV